MRTGIHGIFFLCLFGNTPFLRCFEPQNESENKFKVFIVKISFHSFANKDNFHMKSLAFSLAFITTFTSIRKWAIVSATSFPGLFPCKLGNEVVVSGGDKIKVTH